MDNGETIAGRFVIDREVASGGMGRVYRALDEQTGDVVAVKVLVNQAPSALPRFLKESAVLAQIHHPGIVRYIAHGHLGGGSAYLAMEWLDGEDLSQFLRRRRIITQEHDTLLDGFGEDLQLDIPPPDEDEVETIETVRTDDLLHHHIALASFASEPLPVDQTVIMGRRVAAALAQLHDRGIVHRDVKPANLFLPGGRIEQVKLLDFGTIQRSGASDRFTAPGHILGTPHYMAPEQARVTGQIVPATDVWALGCVLYQCLTGLRPFEADDLMAVLTCILLQPPTPITMLRPEIPEPLSQLIMQALAKKAGRRPPDAVQFLAALDALGTFDRADTMSSLADQVEPSSDDVAAQPPATRIGQRDVLTRTESRVTCMLFADASRVSTVYHEQLVRVSTSSGGRLERLANNALLVTVPDTYTPLDQATLVGRTALSLRDEFPDLAIVLASGRLEGSTPLGPAVSAAARLLRRCGPGEIRVDTATASLLDTRFDLRTDRRGIGLAGERPLESTRTLLGKPTEWVGRRREMAILLATFDECVEDEVARAVVVTAPAGMGKSRLCHEFLEQLQQRGDRFELIRGRGDAVGEGSPFVMIGPAVRRLAGIRDGEPPEMRRDKLRRRLAATIAEAELDRVAAFIGEMSGVPFPDETSDALRAARKDPIFLGQLMQAAWKEWLAAECSSKPVLLILEDLHWGDLPSVQYVDDALVDLHDRPLMVLALARPEVHTMFPELWAKRSVYGFPMAALSSKASTRLVRSVLGDDFEHELVARVVDLAGGNAFYLEELIRAVAEGTTDELPETVLGMVQARLDALGPDGKRILRAGSIFGEVFWQGGVEALLGESGVFDLGEWLDELVAREVVLKRPEARIPGEREYEIRHALLRDGAYSGLTDEDRRLGHALAGDWLERVGETDPLVLAEHFMRGDAPQRAIPCFYAAAQQALEGNDLHSAVQHAEHAVAAGASGAMLGKLRALQSVANYWLSDYAASRDCGIEAAALLPLGSSPWWNAMGSAIVSCFRLGERTRGEELFAAAAAAERQPDAEAEQVICLSRSASQLVLGGRFHAADPVLERIGRLNELSDELDPRTAAQVHDTRGLRAVYADDWQAALHHYQECTRRFDAAGDTRNALMARTSLSLCWAEFGHFDRAVELCRQNLDDCLRSGAQPAISFARAHLGYFLTYHGDATDEVRSLLLDCIAEYHEAGNSLMEGWARARLSMLEHRLGDHDAARRASARAVELLEDSSSFYPWALVVHAQSLLAAGRLDEAQQHVDRAMKRRDGMNGPAGGEGFLHRVRAEVMDARGDRAGARTAIAEALACIERRASRIDDSELRDHFLRAPESRTIDGVASRLGVTTCGHPPG